MDDTTFSFDLNEIEMKSKKDEDSLTINSDVIKKKLTNKSNKNDETMLTKILSYLEEDEKRDYEILEKLSEFEKKLDKFL
ncbi:hypothetical protein TUBRATIS_25490 [Tubulinosema ratisbonensis]|uniref:Uncharacterized protein n=1 Tax=Tubulinosema ratisbonensis TaxID=291195 RepID=A0A437AIK0_9MICR|nr:hypothetical protein TUBRATIS_25490 [Tubulinosema ratisbonensis]